MFDLNKYKTIGALRPNYKKARRTVRREPNGSNEVEHWDGRQDAHIVIDTVKIKGTCNGLG